MGYKGDWDRTNNRNQYESNYEQIDWGVMVKDIIEDKEIVKENKKQPKTTSKKESEK